jgi:hypothetical protein
MLFKEAISIIVQKDWMKKRGGINFGTSIVSTRDQLRKWDRGFDVPPNGGAQPTARREPQCGLGRQLSHADVENRSERAVG